MKNEKEKTILSFKFKLSKPCLTLDLGRAYIGFI